MRLQFYVLLVLMFLSSIFASAQTTTTGGVAGVITDPSGAVVPGVTITLTSNINHSSVTTKSNSTGSYRFDLVEPGSYTVEVEHPGYQKLATHVAVSASQVVDVGLKLVIGGGEQTIEVTAQTELLQAENGNVASTVTHAQVEEVPNSGNNLLFETRITPGMVNTNFGVVGSTQYLVDGQNFNDPYNNASNSGATNMTLGLNDVDEATIIANGYSGQYGGLVGATASFTTKSGGNRLHGNATWFWTGRALIANTYLHKTTTPITPRAFENINQWAAMISGPVTIPHLIHGKDRLFFLADSEGVRAIAAATASTVVVPSTNLQAYTIKTLTNAGLTNSIPYYQKAFAIWNASATANHAQPGNPTLSSAASQATGCDPTSNNLNATDYAALSVQGPGACTDYFSGSAPNFTNESLEIFRVDANLGAKDKMFVRYEHDYGVQPTETDPINAGFNALSIQPQHDGQLNETHIFGSNIVNNFILGSLWYGAKFGPTNMTAVTDLFPAGLSVNELTGLDTSIGSFPTGRNVTTIQLQDDVAITHGVQTFKFGFKGYGTKWNDYYFSAGVIPVETSTSLSAFINGGVDPLNPASKYTSFSQAFPVRPNWNVRVNQFAFYGEDDWKANSSLNFTFALRLEHQGNEYCPDGCLTQLNTDFNSLNHSASVPYNQIYNFNQKQVFPHLQPIEWQPRFGFAYNPSFMQSFVVRGGFGLFYDGLPQNVINGIKFNPPADPSFSLTGDNLAQGETTNLWTDTQTVAVAFASGITNGLTTAQIKASIPAAAQKAFTPPYLFTSQQKFKMYYVEKWNFEVQKLFGSKTSIDINYLGNHGLHRPFTNAGLNGFSPTGSVAGLPTVQPDSRFATVMYYTSGGSTNYNGVIATFVRKFSKGSIFTAAYTYGKTLSTGADGLLITTTGTGTTDIGAPPDPYNPNRFYGPDSTDVRNTMVLNYVYKVPYKNVFYGHWTVSGDAIAYSGQPYTAMDTTQTSLASYTGGSYGATPLGLYIGGKAKKCNYYGDDCLSGLYNATTNPSGQFKSANSVAIYGPRNAWTGPSFVSTDLSLSRDIPLHWEGGIFKVSAQAFNVLNHPNFSKPSGSLSSGSFAKVTSTVNPSGVLSSVGGDNSARILQLQAKIVF